MKQAILGGTWFVRIRKLLADLFDKGNKRVEGNGVMADNTRAIPLKSSRIPAWFYRGKNWSNKGEQDKAIENYTEAIRLDPDYVNAFIGRGVSWGEKGEYDKAIADYDEAIRLDPNNQHAIRNRTITISMKQIEG